VNNAFEKEKTINFYAYFKNLISNFIGCLWVYS